MLFAIRNNTNLFGSVGKYSCLFGRQMGGKGIFLVNLGRHQDATATNTTKKYPGIPVINVVLRGMAGRMQEGDREDSKVESVTLHRNSRSPAENY